MGRGSDNEAAILAAIGLASLAGNIAQGNKITEQTEQMGHLEHNVQALRKQNEQLRQFYNHWLPINNMVAARNSKLAEYQLVEAIRLLGDKSAATFKQALNCFVFGHDIAAGNMLVLTLEILFRDYYENDSAPLAQLIDRLGEEKTILPHVMKQLHILRAIRNTHSHGLIELDELALLGLFKAVGEVAILL